ncbi:MAG: acyl-CoA dehydrogenase family protein [Gammaproteobacteria bacterium]|nr:acyl-CoA dehydrogenase family protein [Gammaproteobacteria bacterium]
MNANDVKAQYQLSPEQEEIISQFERFGREELLPLQEKMDLEDWWPEDLFSRFAAIGGLGTTISPEYGGSGLDYFTAGLIGKTLSKYNPAAAFGWGAHENLCLNNIYRNANEAIKKKYLPKLCDGTLIGALGLTEPGAGSDALGSMATTATRDGDDYILNGRKLYITNGPIADVLLVYAKTDKSLGPHGISAFVIESDFPGFSVAQTLDKMGFRGNPTGELVFDDCRVPTANLVGQENQGVSIVMSGLDLERAFVSMVCLGISERALELAVDYVQTREQFGKPLGSFQMVQSKIADMYSDIETMRSLSYRVLSACNNLEIGGGGRGEIHKLTAASVKFAARAQNRVVTEAVHLHGGSGYMQDTEINRLYRTNKLLEIGAGTTEVRNLIISGELLK